MTRPDHPRLTKVLYQAWLDAWQEAFSDVPDALAAALDENPDIREGGLMDDLRALAEAATKGWDRPRLVDLYNASELSLDGCRYVQAIDPTTLLALLDERDALREALQAAEAELRDTKCGIIAGLRWLGRPLVITPHNLMDDDGWAMESSERLDGSIELRAVRAALASARDGAGEGGA